MNIKIYSIAIVIMILFSGCSNSDDNVTIMLPTGISFAKQDGTTISPLDCVDPNENYVVSIKVDPVGNGPVSTATIEYTLNGILYSMTFTGAGTRVNPVILREGQNIAQIVGTGLTTTVFYVSPPEFELVE